MCDFCPVGFSKSAQNQPIKWVLWGPKGTHPDMQVIPQAYQYIAMHSQGKRNAPAVIISSMNRGTHHNVSILSCALLLNLPKTSPSNGCCRAWRGCILTCSSCPKLANLLPCIHKANETCRISSMDRGNHHNVSFLSCAFLLSLPQTSQLMGAVRPERDAS